jgi:hypothetical protein
MREVGTDNGVHENEEVYQSYGLEGSTRCLLLMEIPLKKSANGTLLN